MMAFFLVMAKPNPLSWKEVKSGYMSGINETKASWYDTLYAELIDNPSDKLIFVFLGQRPTGGYSINVKDVKSDGKKIYIIAEEICPKPDAMVVQVVTTPFTVIKVEIDKKLPLELKVERCKR